MGSPENHGRHLEAALDRTACKKHSATKGVSCWTIEGSNGKLFLAICNRRIRNAGFIGKISPGSMRRAAPIKQKPLNQRSRALSTQ
jgi:hypothetical protein